MSLDNMIAATGTLLAAVNGVGANVHTYERWAADEARFKELFVDGGKVLGWTITREKSKSVDYINTTSLDAHEIVIRGWMSLSDAEGTERTFQQLIEAIRDAFQNNRRLVVAGVSKATDSDRIEVRIVEPRMFAGILCHYCELVLRAKEFVH